MAVRVLRDIIRCVTQHLSGVVFVESEDWDETG